MPARRLSAALLFATLVVAGCAGETPGDDSSESTAAAPARANRGDNIGAAQLELDDFPPGWERGEDPGPGTDGADPIYECLAGDLASRLDEATTDATDDRTFFNPSEAPVSERVSSSSLAVDDEAVLEEVHTQLRSQEVGDCLAETFAEELTSGGEYRTQLLEVDQAQNFIDPGDDAALTSSGVSTTVDVTTEGGASQKARVTVVFLNTGTVGSWMTVYSPDATLGPESLSEWGRFLAERLQQA